MSGIAHRQSCLGLVLLLTGAVATAATFTVNSTNDKPDKTIGDGICADTDGNCTLRAAIQEANANAGTDMIAFGIPGTGVHTITPATALPDITDPVIIDGTTQTGYAATPLIELNGSAVAPGNGLTILAGSSTVKGLAINRFGHGIVLLTGGGNVIQGNFLGTNATGTASLPNSGDGIYVGSADNFIGGNTPAGRNVASGNGGAGIEITGAGASGNTVQNNRIGTDASGTAKIPNTGNGIYIDSANNVIGGTDFSVRNLISGNALPGIGITGSGATGNIVQGNFIGTDVFGTAPLGNAQEGVVIVGGASSNMIGGAASGARNIVSGSVGASGVSIVGTSTTGNKVLGNYIGTDSTGTAALPNAGNGVFVQAPGNFVGGSSAAESNVIAGNTLPGIFLGTADAHDNLVQGNLIGVNASGAALPNSKGIVVDSAPNNTIGGTVAGAGNVISGNTLYGVEIRNAGATGNKVLGNWIGSNAAGANRHNGGDGVLINATTGNFIGGTAAGEANVIAFNTGNGVTVTGAAATGNSIRGDSIHDNGGLGIDLGADGVTANDPGDTDTGPNSLMNFPVGVSAVYDGASNTTILRGHVDTANPTTVQIDFYASDTSDPSGHGEGKTYLTSATPDASGSFCISIAGKLPGDAALSALAPRAVPFPPYVTATATDAAGSTSEFSQTNAIELFPLRSSCTSHSIEVTQSVQDLSNSVPLIADKRTFVRFHVAGLRPASGITAKLEGSQGGASLGAALQPLNRGAVINVATVPHRTLLDDSFYFELPKEWIHAGTITLRAQIDPAHTVAEDDPGNNSDSVDVTFAAAKTPSLRIVNYQYYNGGFPGGVLVSAAALDQSLLESELRRMYPISKLNVVRRTFVDYVSAAVPTSNVVNGVLLWIRNNWNAGDPGVVYYGMVDDSGGFMRGSSAGIPSFQASGPTGNPQTFPNFRWDTDAAYGDWYGCHEIGHALGRHHSTFCGAVWAAGEVAPAYPYPNGLIGGPATSPLQFAGFDAGDARFNIAPQPVSPNWTDIMTYCAYEWASDFTYKGLSGYINATFPAVVAGSTTMAAARTQTTGDFLSVYGTIDFASDAASFVVLSRQSEVATVPPLVAGPYRIRLLDGAGGILADHPFTPLVSTDDGDTGIIQQIVDFAAGTKRITIFSDATGHEIASRQVSANPPTVSILSRSGGPSLPASGPVTLSWSGSDVDGDALTYTVLYSPTSKSTWRAIATGIAATSLPLEASELEGTGGAASGYLRVVASDGVLTGLADNGPFTVAGKPPQAQILSPANGAVYQAGQVVTLEGLGEDYEDGTLGDAQLSWSSSLDGALGTGHLIHTAALSLGTHTLTLTATDSNGQTGTSTVSVTIAASVARPGPTLVAGPAPIRFFSDNGGPAPAPEQLGVRNSGTGTVTWSASADASWVTLSPASGIAPSELRVGVDPSALTGPGTYTAHITITSTGSAGSPQVLTVTEEVIPQTSQTTDLSVTSTASPDPVMLGGSWTHSIQVKNVGPATATGVTLTDPVPSGLAFVSADSDRGTCELSAGVITCALGDLSSGATANVTVVLLTTRAGSACDTVSVSGDQIDPNSDNDSSSACATVEGTGSPVPGFFTLTPCRILDTRNADGPLGGPALVAGAVRTFPLVGTCGIPADARSVSLNVTITQPTAAGDLRLFPGGAALPLVSTINYRAGQTRANNAIATLGDSGDLSVRCDQTSGTVHLIVDVNGYFE